MIKRTGVLSVLILLHSYAPLSANAHLALPRAGGTPRPCVKSNRTFDITYEGFVKLDWFYDSRQAFTDLDGDTALLPKPPLPDIFCRDINSKGAFNITTLETRLRTDIRGPRLFGAQSGAVVEAEFGGRGIIRQRFSLRHGYMTLDWDRWFLLIGQYWHPIYRLECAPHQLATDGGAPFEAVLREPQVNVAYRLSNVAFYLTAISQLSSVNNGPSGFRNLYFRNSLMPNFYFNVEGTLGDHVIGAGVGVKRLVPRIVSNTNFKVNESLISDDGIIYASLRFDPVTLNMKITAGQNLVNYTFIGGYAVSHADPCTDERTYRNLNTVAFWTELFYTHPRVEPAIFIGYTKNLGASKEILLSVTRPDGSLEETLYPLFENVDSAVRIAPHVRLFFEPITFGFEIELTRAGFGTTNSRGNVINPVQVNNIRVQASATYTF